MTKDLILKPKTKPTYAILRKRRGKLEENEWKYLVYALINHDIVEETSSKDDVFRYLKDSQLAEHFGVNILTLKKKLKELTARQLDALCMRVYSYWHPQVTFYRVNKDKFIPANNLFAQTPSEDSLREFCRY